MVSPSANGPNGKGRDSKGRFAKGNPGGPGSPYARRVAALRSAMLEAVSGEDVREIVAKLVQQAKEGDIHAAKEVLLRVLGRPLETDVLERIEELQVAVDRLTEREKRW